MVPFEMINKNRNVRTVVKSSRKSYSSVLGIVLKNRPEPSCLKVGRCPMDKSLFSG